MFIWDIAIAHVVRFSLRRNCNVCCSLFWFYIDNWSNWFFRFWVEWKKKFEIFSNLWICSNFFSWELYTICMMFVHVCRFFIRLFISWMFIVWRETSKLKSKCEIRKIEKLYRFHSFLFNQSSFLLLRLSIRCSKRLYERIFNEK